jgi:hypothetical protein
MDQRAIDGQRAQIDELRKRAAWYEELRQATDGGSESMTHEDAVEHVNSLAAENNVLRDLLGRIPAELRTIAMDYGMNGNIWGVDTANYCADHVEALTKEATNG